MANKEAYEKIIRFFDPNYQHRWTLYEKYLRSFFAKDKTWLDIGCGTNEDVEEKKDLVKLAVGTDIYKHENLKKELFLLSEGSSLPFKSGSIDIISLRFVVEHIENPNQLFEELNRVLRKNGIVVVLTTNLWSPIIFLPKIIPYKLRKYIMKLLFDVYEEDIFPTYHRFNSIRNAKSVSNNFEIEKTKFVQALNADNHFVFAAFMFWHLLTKIKFLTIFRSNILMIFKKK